MAGEDSAAGSVRAGGLLGSTRSLLATIVELAHTRLQLLANEIEEEKLRFGQVLLFAVVAVLFFALGVTFLTLLVIVQFWDTHRVLAIGCIVVVYLALGALFGVIALKRARAGTRLFSASLRELSRDRDRLSS
jgi:uncharacterized membrane protein YqjE